MKREEKSFINEKIDRLAFWMKKSLDFELDDKTVQNLKKGAGKTTDAIESLMATMLANPDHKQPVEKDIGLKDLFSRMRRVLPQITEADARRTFSSLKELIAKELERRKNRKN